MTLQVRPKPTRTFFMPSWIALMCQVCDDRRGYRSGIAVKCDVLVFMDWWPSVLRVCPSLRKEVSRC